MELDSYTYNNDEPINVIDMNTNGIDNVIDYDYEWLHLDFVQSINYQDEIIIDPDLNIDFDFEDNNNNLYEQYNDHYGCGYIEPYIQPTPLHSHSNVLLIDNTTTIITTTDIDPNSNNKTHIFDSMINDLYNCPLINE